MSLRQSAREIFANKRAHQGLNAFVYHAQNYEAPKPKGILAKTSHELPDDLRTGSSKSPVDGRLIAVKDNICTKNEGTTCASGILRDYESPFAATIIEKLKAAGALINGKTNLDEFGMGSHSIYSYHGRVKSHLGDDVSAGGSSGGSAVAVATDQCWAALGTDTGGSVRLPAAYTGTVGFKPSYGMVSRWGVVAYANSLDTVGILAHSSEIARKVFEVIKGHDSKDPTSISIAMRSNIHNMYLKLRDQRRRSIGSGPLRIGIPKEYSIEELEPIVRGAWLKTLILLQEDGHEIHAISLPTTQAALSAYYIIAPAEASSNLAKYDGVRFGRKNSDRSRTGDVLYAPTRGNGLGDEVKRRILLGSYSLSAAAMDNYFIKAQKVRRLVQKDFNHVFARRHPLLESAADLDNTKGVDVIISPTAPTLPPRLGSVEDAAAADTYSDDVFTVPASLAGLPAINVPVPIDAGASECSIKAAGLQIICQYGDDDFLLDVADSIQDLCRV